MDNKLIIQHENLPLRSYPDDKLKKEMDVFSKWINDLLGLNGVDAAKRLLIALPAVQKHFWSMGFKEIEKAFTMYVDGELTTQPIPNYFTRILVGQIFKEFKQQKRTKPKHKDMDKAQEDYLNVINWYDWFIQNRKVTVEMTWIYEYLILRCEEFTPKEKFKNRLVQKGIDQGLTIMDSKAKTHRTLIKMFFERLEAKGEHLKDKL